MYIFFFDFAIQCLIGRWFTSCVLMLSSSFMSMLTHLSFWIKWSLCCLQSRAVTHWSGWIKWSSCCLQPRTMMGIWKHVIIILMILFHGFWAKDMGYLCGAIWEQLGEHMGTKSKKCSPPPPPPRLCVSLIIYLGYSQETHDNWEVNSCELQGVW